jgi:Uma2 family endonuclease
MSASVAATSVFTPEDLLAIPDGKDYELVGGQLVERKVGLESSWVGGRVHCIIEECCERNPIGWALLPDSGYQCFPHDPGMVRKPDVSFVRYGRFAGGVLPKGWAKLVPDLVVEVISPNDLAYEVEEKIQDYQKAGVPLIWVINPEARSVRIHRADGSYAFLREDDVLSGEDVIPEFRCVVREIMPRREPAIEKSAASSAGPNGNSA